MKFKMFSVLVTGANRGIGLGIVKKLSSHLDAPSLILAACRDPANAKDLRNLSDKDSKIKIVQLDVSDPSSFDNFARTVADAVGENGLSVLINNAVIRIHKDLIAAVTEEDYIDVYKTNLVGPVFLIKALLPLITKAADRNSGVAKGFKRAAIINVSSKMGSVGLNNKGGDYGYRESKAALNTFSRNLSIELETSGILVVPIHPGWVQTDLGGSNAPLTVDQSTQGLVDVFYSLTGDNHGEFLQWDGQKLEW